MKKLFVISLIVLLAVGVLVARKHDQRANPMMKQHQQHNMQMHPMMGCMDELKLTEAQSTKINEARTTFQKLENTAGADIENLRIDVIAAFKAENFTKVKELHKQISAKELQISDARVDMMSAIMKELTKEQKEIMQKNMPMMLQQGMARDRGMQPGMMKGMQQMKRNCMNDNDDCKGSDCHNDKNKTNKK